MMVCNALVFTLRRFGEFFLIRIRDTQNAVNIRASKFL